MMMRLFATLVLMLSLGVSLLGHAEEPDGLIKPITPVPLPDVPLSLLSGPSTLGTFRGSPMIINIWATWCPPCVAELPALERLQRRYEGSGLKVVPISFDAGPNTVREMFGRMGLSALDIIIGDEMAVSPALGVQSLPTSFLVDASGRIVARIDGPRDWTDAGTATAINMLLKTKKPQSQAKPIQTQPPQIRDVHL